MNAPTTHKFEFLAPQSLGTFPLKLTGKSDRSKEWMDTEEDADEDLGDAEEIIDDDLPEGEILS